MGTVFRFGPFESNPRSRELRKHGSKLRIRPQPLQVLNLLLSRPGDVVTREEIRAQLWSNDTFVDFEHSLNTSIRELRATLDDSATHPRFIETLPRIGYRFIASVSEIKADAQAIASAASNSSPSNPLFAGSFTHAKLAASRWFVPLALLLVFVLAFGIYLARFRISARSSPVRPKVMLAVLPFQNLTGDATQDYFSAGLTGEIVAALGRVDPSHLGVVTDSAASPGKQPAPQASQIGRQLGADYALQGSVQRELNRYRVTTQLIRTQDHTEVWSHEYDRDSSTVLILEDEIAQEVADEIEPLINPGSRPSSTGHVLAAAAPPYQAHDLYLKGRYSLNKRTAGGFRQAASYFQKAISSDPDYAQAYSGLAETYVLMSSWHLVPQNDYIPKARGAAIKALQLDEKLPEAHTSLALIAENYDYDWDTAEKEYRRAIELDPNYPTAHQWHAECLAYQGLFDEALAESEHARQLDPLSLIISADHGAILYYARQNDRAIEQFRNVLDIEPGFTRAHVIIYAYVQAGRYAEALADIANWRRVEDAPETWAAEAFVYGRWGRPADARRSLAKFQQLAQQKAFDPTPWLVLAYAGMGQSDDALSLLEKARAEHSNLLTSLKVEPAYDPLRTDPRFQALLASAGLAQ
jgi:TolB-like protein/DNA-binding winged helix-turn-helix (wHTH) protein/Tfp pilus assembly protein PilF